MAKCNSHIKENRPIEVIEKEIMTYRNVPVSLTAEYLGFSEMAVRCGLRYNVLPIGSAVVQTKKRYTYHISPYRLIHYMGRDAQQEEAVIGLA